MYINTHLSVNIGVNLVHVTGTDRPVSPDYQFLLVQKGAVALEYEETKEKFILQKDDVILIPPKVPYSCSPITSNTLLGIRLDVPYFNTILVGGYVLECNSTKGPKKMYQPINRLLVRMCSILFSDCNENLLAACVYELTDCLKSNFLHKKGDVELSDIEARNQERISTIVGFINNHYHQQIPLSSLADKMFLTPQYLSKFFKKNFGTTYSKYLTGIRLEHAHTELVKTDTSITNIALDNGFPTIAAFNKAFREVYSLSPSSYRHKHPKHGDLPPETAKEALQDIMESSCAVSLQISAKEYGPYQKPWQDTLNIGPLSDALKLSFHKSFVEYQKKIPVKYVRFCNVFEEDIISLNPAAGEYDFTKLDEIMDFFYERKVIPFIELSFKPPKNHVILSELSNEAVLFNKEKDVSYYHNTLKAMLKHCIDYYGISYVSQWRFEVWAKHEEKLLHTESYSSYIKKFMGYYRIIKELLPECQIGGPGFNICGDINSFKSLLAALEEKKLPFDFVSLYAFGYELQTSGAKADNTTRGILSPEPDHIYNTFLKYRSLLQKSLYMDKPLYITEFGSSLSLQNYITDSVFQAAFLCRNLLNFIADCNCVAYLSFFDNASFLTPVDYCYPASGLISDSRIPRPSYYAYTFLFRLGKYLISHGDHYIMTCNTKNQFQLLFYHYVHFSKGFCFNSWDPIPMENTYEIFEGSPSLKIHFICRDIPLGRYKVTKYSLNRSYGSVLDKYLRILEAGNTTSGELLSTILNLREDEANYYRQTSIPRQDIYYLPCHEYLELTLELSAHEIVFYELTRIL